LFSFLILANLEENYVAMAPVKKNFYFNKNSLNESKAAAQCKRPMMKSAFEFNEFTSDKLLTSPVCETDSQ